MEIKTTLKLTRPAKKSGGDRYEGELEGSPITFYVPQSISRPDDKEPRKEVTLTLS